MRTERFTARAQEAILAAQQLAEGEGHAASVTALGDAVNVAARLAALAAAGEILVTTDAAMAAGIDPSLPRQMLDLRGKLQQTEVISLRV